VYAVEFLDADDDTVRLSFEGATTADAVAIFAGWSSGWRGNMRFMCSRVSGRSRRMRTGFWEPPCIPPDRAPGGSACSPA